LARGKRNQDKAQFPPKMHAVTRPFDSSGFYGGGNGGGSFVDSMHIRFVDK
jgi:hypothetical protein